MLIRFLAGIGFVPGKDLSVVGFDIPAALCLPQITAIRQLAVEMGSFAAELLLERIVNPSLNSRSLRLSAQLQPGETTGPVPG